MNRYKVILDLGGPDIEGGVFWTYPEALDYAYDRLPGDVVLTEDTGVRGQLARLRARDEIQLTGIVQIWVSA